MYLSKSVRIGFVSLVGIFLLIALPGLAKIDPDSITGMWLFNEGKGNTATDSSGNGNDGEIHGAKWVDGKFGKALEFNGTDNWVEVPHSDTVGFKGGTCHSRSPAISRGPEVAGALVGKNYEDTSQVLPWYLLWNGGADNKVTLYLRDGASTSFRANGITEIGDDKWHFVVGRADADAGKASIWIDGKMDAEADFNTKDGYGTGEGVFHVARHYDRYTEGIIDDVAIFNVALEEEDIKFLMENGVETAAAVEPVNKLTTTWGRIKNSK